jgi:AcrR family transcriptional regulator
MADSSKAKPGARPYGREAVKKALIEAAAPLIAKHGVEGITTRSVAKAAGVNQGLISRHFGSKDALVREVARSLARRLFEESQARHDDIATMLDRGFSGQSGQIRALVRILLDTEDRHAVLFDEEFSREILQWLRSQDGNAGSRSRQSSTVRLYLIAVLILGGEVVDPSVRRSLKLNEKSFERLRRQAMKLVLTIV